MSYSHEHQALSAYLKLLKSKGTSEEKLKQRESVVLKLIPFIEKIPGDGFLYRKAVDKFFQTVDQGLWSAYLPVVRDYFSFWSNDIKAIAALNADSAFDVEPKEWRPAEANLKKLWASLDETTLTGREQHSFESYEKTLRQEGADDFFVDASLKLAKLLLLRLREAPHVEPKVYRNAVDSNLPLFTMKETHHMFLQVGREFYYFWKGDSNAASQVLRTSAHALAA